MGQGQSQPNNPSNTTVTQKGSLSNNSMNTSGKTTGKSMNQVNRQSGQKTSCIAGNTSNNRATTDVYTKMSAKEYQDYQQYLFYF